MRCTSPRWDALENSKIIIILKRTLCSRKRRYRSSLTKVGPGCRVIILMWWLLRLLFCWILLSVFCVLYFCWTGLRRSQLANKIDLLLLLLFYSPIDYTRLLRRSDLLLFLQHLVHQSIYPSIKMEHNKTRRYCENLRSITDRDHLNCNSNHCGLFMWVVSFANNSVHMHLNLTYGLMLIWH